MQISDCWPNSTCKRLLHDQFFFKERLAASGSGSTGIDPKPASQRARARVLWTGRFAPSHELFGPIMSIATCFRAT
jgi:hypothetical protein